MSAQQIISRLIAVEIDGSYDYLTRRMMRDERMRVQAAIQCGRGIAEAKAEAERVARMWGVL
jgi:hypothetical protein